MLVDIFGVPLAVGMFVLYADYSVDGERPELSVYKILELEEPNVVTGEALNGDTIGVRFVLEDMHRRSVIVGGETALYNLADCYTSSTVN